MRLIDADALRKCVMKWLPKDPCGIEEKEFPFETDICVSMLMEIDEQPTIEPQKWVSCSERMPEEHDSIFSKFYGTEKWRDAMFRKTSKTVIITVEYRDGTRQTAPCHTIDGEWNQSMKGMGKVIAWMPLPECYGGD